MDDQGTVGGKLDMANDKQTVISRPLARSERLLIEAVGDESVVYDLDTNVAHALKPLAAAVFLFADGSNSTAEIAELAGYRLDRSVSEAEVDEAVAALDQLALLQTPEVSLGESGISRRTALKTFGAVGVGTLLVSSVAAPAAFADVTADYTCGINETSSQTQHAGVGPVTDADKNGQAPVQGFSAPSVDLYAYELIGSKCGAGTEMCIANGNWWSTPVIPMYPASGGGKAPYLCPTGWATEVSNNVTTCVQLVSSTGQGNSNSTTTNGWTFTPGPGVCANSATYIAANDTQTPKQPQTGTYGTGSGWNAPATMPATYKNSSTDYGFTPSGAYPDSNATYQCVPCSGGAAKNGAGGTRTYACCQVVCVPSNVTFPANSGVIATQADWSSKANQYTHAPALSGYTDLYCTSVS